MSLHDLFRQVMAIYEQEKREKLSKERRSFQLVTRAIRIRKSSSFSGPTRLMPIVCSFRLEDLLPKQRQ